MAFVFELSADDASSAAARRRLPAADFRLPLRRAAAENAAD